MSDVIINEFEVVENDAGAGGAEAQPKQAAEGSGQPIKPRQIVDIIRHFCERELRVRAH